MERPAKSDAVLVYVCFGPDDHSLRCERHMTMAQVRDAWHAEIGASPSAAFFTPDRRCLSDRCTVSQVLLQSNNHRILELHAFARSTYWLQVYGYEESLTPFEIADILTPAAVRRDIEEAVGIVTEDYRLSWNGAVLDQERPFSEQGLPEGAALTVDLRLIVNIDVERPEGTERRTLSLFGSQTVGDLRRDLSLEDDTVIVATFPYRRLISDSLHLCHIVSDVMELHAPVALTAEKKVALGFEPVSLPHRRQQVAVAPSSTPLDLHEMLSERFEMEAEFQLSVAGEPLDQHRPLIEQNLDSDTVIQLDVLRQFKVTDHWADMRELRHDDDVFLFSTESPQGLFLRDFTGDQTLFHEGVKLAVFGSVIDISD